MIAIYIFEENHRFSEKTPHPGLHSVVDAANRAQQPPERNIFRQNRLPQFCKPAVLP